MSMSKTLYTRKCSKITTDLIKEEHELQKIEVLLADDNREFTNLLGEYISDQQDMVVSGIAYNGEEVLSMIEESGKVPDVLILDIIMPHLDGLGVLERLRDMNLSPHRKSLCLRHLVRKILRAEPYNWGFLLYFEAV